MKIFLQRGEVSYLVLFGIAAIAIFLVGGGAVIDSQYNVFGHLVFGKSGGNSRTTEQLGFLSFITYTPTPSLVPPLIPSPSASISAGISPSVSPTSGAGTPTNGPFPPTPSPTGTLAACVGGSTICRYEKFEVAYPYAGSYSNPYDPNVVDVEGTFTSPSGKKMTVPGFYFQDYTRSGSTTKETLSLISGSDKWKVRYAPSELGNYTYVVTLKDSSGTKTLGSGNFSVGSSLNPGFVRAQGYHLQFDSGDRYIPVGANAPWFQSNISNNKLWGDGTYGFDNMLSQYLTNGGNTFAIWTCSSFAHPSINCDAAKVSTLTTMSQPDSWQLDYMVTQSQAHHIYVIPVMKNVDQKAVDPGDPIAIRYYVARWGYATAIAAWSTFKEGAYNAPVVHQYHQILTSTDPYGHLITASQGNHADDSGGAFNAVASDPLETLVQPHDYTNNCKVPYESDAALYFVWHALKINLRQFNKPYWIGETGVHLCAADGVSDSNSTNDTASYGADSQGRILRSESWGEFMATAGALAPWNYFLTSNVVAFKGISAFINALPPGPIPDSANIVTNYNNMSPDVTSSDPKLEVIGRKNSTFAILRVQNTTGTWAAILRDHQTPTPVSGSVTLLNMSGGSHTVKWYDTVSGALIKTSSVITTGTSLVLPLPNAISEDIAAMITTP